MSSPILDEQSNTAAKAALQEHARVNGYGIGIESSTQKRIFFQYVKGRKYDDRFKDPIVHVSKQRKIQVP